MFSSQTSPNEPEGSASAPKSGWNPFAPFKPERIVKSTEPRTIAPATSPKQPAVTNQDTDTERQRIARAWNGLQLPL